MTEEDVDKYGPRTNLTNEAYVKKWLIDNLYYVCKDKKVLDIASHTGKLLQYVKEVSPTHITSVEVDTRVFHELRNLSIDEIISDDIFNYLSSPKKFDVVICQGLLYHMHSPFMLLELIANRTDAEYVILDSMDRSLMGYTNSIVFRENVNFLGARNTSKDWKFTHSCIYVNPKFFKEAMIELGYRCIFEYNSNGDDNFKNVGWKHLSWFGLFKKSKHFSVDADFINAICQLVTIPDKIDPVNILNSDISFVSSSIEQIKNFLSNNSIDYKKV